MEEEILRLVEKANPSNPISFVHNIVKPLAKGKLDKYIQNCEDCSISNCSKSLTLGNPNASVLIIGESPTEDDQEQEYAEPFNNKQGDILYKVLDKLKVNKDEIFFINSVNCFPHRMNGDIQIKRAPTKTERNNCKVFLDYTLKMVEPLLIICLGSVATNGINEEIGKINIGKIRGNYFYYRGIEVMPTYHPGFFIELEKNTCFDEEYINALQWDFFNDIEKALKDLNIKYPDLNIILGDD